MGEHVHILSIDLPFRQRALGQLHELARLAWPVMISRAGILVMAIVDIVMVGRYSTAELAYASLGMSLFVPFMVSGIGLLLGTVVLVSQNFGAGRLIECGRAWRRALPWALLIGTLGGIACAFGEFWLTLMGHDPVLAREGGRVSRAVAVGVPAQLLYVVCTSYLEGIKRPLPGMVAMLAANLLNVAFNWVFIFGHLGAPAMGAVGSALTTAIIRVVLFAALFIYIITRPDAREYGVFARTGGFIGPDGIWGPGGWAAGARMRSIGWAAGASVFFETAAYSIITQFAGLMGAEALAAYSIAYNLEATFFMIALGISSASGVLVGAAYGRGDLAGATFAGWMGLGAVIAVMMVFGAAVWAFAPQIAGIYTNDAALAALATPLMALVGGLIVIDGGQLAMGQAVRALGDTWAATRRYAIAFCVIMTPLAWLLGVELGYGPVGLLWAIAAGCLASLTMQAQRFHVLSRQVGRAEK